MGQEYRNEKNQNQEEINMDLNIFLWDIDGVLKRLDICALGREADCWADTHNGKNVIQHVDNDLEILLRAEPSEYLKTIDDLYYYNHKTLNILTSQRKHWREYGVEWLQNHLKCDFEITYTNGINAKLKVLKSDEYLVDDYPEFEKWNQVILIDRKYNRHVMAKYRVHNPDALISIMERLSR